MGGSATPPSPPPDRDPCPDRIPANVTGPVRGITVNSWLEVELDGEAPSVVFVDPVTGEKVGSLAGIRRLADLIRCLERGITYRAYVDAVSGGRVEVTVTRQG